MYTWWQRQQLARRRRQQERGGNSSAAADAQRNPASGVKRPRVAVDKVFFKRLLSLVKVLIPHMLAREVWQLLALTGLLMGRTILTLKIADMSTFHSFRWWSYRHFAHPGCFHFRTAGRNAESLVGRKYDAFVKGVIMLGIAAVPASVVNSGIKYVSSLLQLNFRQRLSRHLHQLYLNGMSFYRASNVGSKIDNMCVQIQATSFRAVFH